MKKPLALGFIGGGKNSAIGEAHKIACQMDGHFKLVAGCFSRNSEINTQTALDWGINTDRVYRDAHAFLETEHKKLDAVVILTPTPTHREIVMACLEYGLTVICEKALVSNVQGALDIQKNLGNLDGRLYVTFNYTGYPMVRELRQRIQTGELGKIQQVMVEMPQEGFARMSIEGNAPSPQPWRCEDADIPTVYLDLGVHLHQLVDFLTNKNAKDVYAVNSHFALVPGVVDTVNIVSRYEDDMVCNYWFGKAALGYRNGLKIRVFGEKGSAEWLQMDPEILRFNNVYGENILIDRTAANNLVASESRYCRFKAGHPAGFIEAFANYYADIAASLNNEKTPFAIGADAAIRGLHFLTQAQRSATHNSKVDV